MSNTKGLKREIERLIHQLIRQEVAPEFGRQRKIERVIRVECFADGVAAEPKKLGDHVMRLPSARAALLVPNRRT
jgi:hypothetical protein